MQITRQPFEVAQHLEARDTQAAELHCTYCGIDAFRMIDEIPRAQRQDYR